MKARITYVFDVNVSDPSYALADLCKGSAEMVALNLLRFALEDNAQQLHACAEPGTFEVTVKVAHATTAGFK